MIAGLPIIATDFAGNREVVTPDIGWLIPPNDYRKLANLLTEIAFNPTVLIEKRANSLKKCKNYDYKNVLKQLLIDMEITSPSNKERNNGGC